MSVDKTLAERGSRYGDFTDHARICQGLKKIMVDELGWNRLSDVQKQALEVIADKIARILNGDPMYADNWHDIQGYAKLAEDRLMSDMADQPTDAGAPTLGHRLVVEFDTGTRTYYFASSTAQDLASKTVEERGLAHTVSIGAVELPAGAVITPAHHFADVVDSIDPPPRTR